jgi:DNA-binding beta-propeller fold protein YncE
MAKERRPSPSARRGACVSTIALVFVVSLNLIATSGVAKATSGDVLRTLIPSPGGNGRAFAFDRATRRLFYTNQGDPHIYVINTKGDPIATLSPVDATRGQPIVYGALAWRATGDGGMLWGGRFDGTGVVDQIDPMTGAVTTTFTFQFPPGDSCYRNHRDTWMVWHLTPATARYG